MRRVPLLIVLFAAGTAFCQHSSPTLSVESLPQAGLCSLSVRSDDRGAAVRLDHQYRGTVPLDMAGITPGSHLLVLSKSGYYDAQITLSLAADTKTTVTVSLEPKTGFLRVETTPADATVIIDGTRYDPGVIEVPAGLLDVEIEAFGFIRRSYSVYIPERMFADITATLEPSPFEAGDFVVSGAHFNPRNAGRRGQARVSFSVSATGSATAIIVDSEGSEWQRLELGPFDDWAQSLSWDGRDERGTPAPDGEYTMLLRVLPGAGVESSQSEYSFSAALVVDAQLILSPVGSFGALPGSVWAPSGRTPAYDGVRIDAYGQSIFDEEAPGGATGAFSMSASISLDNLLEAGLGMEIGIDGSSAFVAGARVATPIQGPLTLSALLDGRLALAATGNASSFRVWPVLGIGTSFINLVVAPFVAANLDDGFALRTGVSAAINAGGYETSASISAMATSGDLAEGLAIAWPLRSA
ncbi:MAG: PEGA domain-containing protein, partial [Spirochaetales bacterium]|nr:PEGA domain-containing protein [Spirochaetales bacterium]